MKALVKFRWVWVALVVVVTAITAAGLEHAVQPDNALTVWFLETDPQLQTYDEFQEQFGNDEIILLHLEREAGVFDRDFLLEVKGLAADLEEVMGVERVHSLLTVQDAWDTPAGLVFHELIPDPIPEDEEALEVAARRVMNNPLFQGRIVNEEGTQTLVWVEMAVMDELDAMRVQVVSDVRSVAADHFGEEGFALAGIGVIYAGLNVITERDFGIFLGLGYLLMFLLLWWIFRQWRIVLASLGVISVGTVVALGVYGLLGHQMNMVTVVIPTLIIVLGIADAVHMPSNFLKLRRDQPDRPVPELVEETLRLVFLPSLLTTLTTMGSFLALTSSPMAVIRELGIFSALGIGAALLATIAWMTVALHSLPESYEPPEHTWLLKVLDRIRGKLETRPKEIALALLAMTVVAVALGSRVEADTYTLGYLPDHHEVVVDHDRITERWGRYTSIEFLLRPASGWTVQDPEVLTAMDLFVGRVVEHPQIRQGFSLADLYRRMAAVFMTEEGEEIEEYREALTPEQIDQLSLLMSMQSVEWDRDLPEFEQNFLAPVMSQEGDLARLTFTAEMMSARSLDELLIWVDEVATDVFGDLAMVEPAGYLPLYVRIIEYVTTSKIRGFFIALGVIFLMLLIGLRSFRLALIGLPANVFPVAVMMGVMGLVGIDLDIATATVGAIVIGIAIDDSVHFLHHWGRAEARGLNWEGCMEYAFGHAGKAALITTVIIMGGFPVLMLAGVKTVFYFGLLTTVAAAAALVADLFLLPLLLKIWPPRRREASP